MGDRLETTWGWLEGAGGAVEVVEGAGVDDALIASDDLKKAAATDDTKGFDL